jgi:hypothetical protein
MWLAAAEARAELWRFVAIGDTGANCKAVDLDEPKEAWEREVRESQQTLVAQHLATVVRELQVRDILFLGDNFYPDGLEPGALGDACVELAFSVPYGGLLPPEHLHLVAGNHDHHAEGSIRRHEELSGRLWTFYGEPKLVHLHPELLDVVFLDSAVLVQDEEAREELGRQLAERLRASTAPWLVLAAHHPLQTIGKHASRGILGRFLKQDYSSSGYRAYRQLVRQAILDAGRSVQLVLAGHDHSLQFLHEEEPEPELPDFHIVSGAGGKLSSVRDVNESRWGAAVPGFVVLELDTEKPHVLLARFFDSTRREVIRQFQIERAPAAAKAEGARR